MNLTEISRGITHIEDLGIEEFLDTVSGIGNYEITEKVDGAQILFGIDENGFYTSRESKGGNRIYAVEDYDITFSNTYKRSAHILLESVLPELKSAGMRPGDQVETEVLFGELPNVVPYSESTNYLIFLRTTQGNANINRLEQKLAGVSTSVPLMSPYTKDGRAILLKEDKNVWQFSRVPVIKNVRNSRQLERKITEMVKYVKSKDDFTNQTILEIIKTPLNKIPIWAQDGSWKDLKLFIKDRKDELKTTVRNNFVMPIKEMLLDIYVRNTCSSFGPLVEDGGWIEGVVLRNKLTGKMVKLVDKDAFGTIREQAWDHRNKLIEAAKGTEGSYSFLADLNVAMATAIGHPQLGTIHAKNYIRKAGTINEERIANLSTGINVDSVKLYWIGLLKEKGIQLERLLDKYKQGSFDTLLERAIKKRTLETFASTFRKIDENIEATKNATNTNDLLIVLVGKQLGET